MLVEIKQAYKSIEKIKELFKEYTDMLVKEDEDVAKYLKLQDYESELENLDIKYGPPKGRLYLATVEGEVAGCIALKYIDEKTCELKRLYVKPEFRGNKIAANTNSRKYWKNRGQALEGDINNINSKV